MNYIPFLLFFNPVAYRGNHHRYCLPLPSLCTCKGRLSMTARNPKMGSFLKMEVFSVSEKTLVCYKRDVKFCINKLTNKQYLGGSHLTISTVFLALIHHFRCLWPYWIVKKTVFLWKF